MKRKKPYSETREKEIKQNCLLTGIVFTAFGAIMGGLVAASVIKIDEHKLLYLVLFCIIPIGVGIYYFTLPKRLKSKESDEMDPGAVRYQQLLDKREKAIEKLRRNISNTNKTLKGELFKKQLSYAAIMVLILPLIGVYFYLSTDFLKLPLILVITGFFALLVIYFVARFGYGSLKSFARKNNIDISDVAEDFRRGTSYGTFNSFLSVGNTYTVILNETKSFILKNENIVGIAPFYQKTDHYNNGIYSGTSTHYYILIFTNDGSTYKIRCADFAEELIIEAYLKNQDFMSENFSVEYPPDIPEYIHQ